MFAVQTKTHHGYLNDLFFNLVLESEFHALALVLSFLLGLVMRLHSSTTPEPQTARVPFQRDASYACMLPGGKDDLHCLPRRHGRDACCICAASYIWHGPDVQNHSDKKLCMAPHSTALAGHREAAASVTLWCF